MKLKILKLMCIRIIDNFDGKLDLLLNCINKESGSKILRKRVKKLPFHDSPSLYSHFQKKKHKQQPIIYA